MPLNKLPVHGLDDPNHLRRARETINQVLDHSFDDSRAQTPAEIQAGITPVNKAYAPGDIRRYGAVGDGVANDSPAVQAAIDVAKIRGGIVIIPQPAQSYRLATQLFAGAPVGPVVSGFIIRGEANINTTVTGFPATFTIDHTGKNAFDCTGTLGVIFENFSVATTQAPDTCFLLARNTDGRSQICRFRHVHVRGSFNKAIVGNFGSEDDQYDACLMFNLSTTNGAKVISWSTNNIQGHSSDFTTIANTAQSTIDHKVFGGEYMIQSSAAKADVFDLEAVEDVRIIGSWARSASDGVGNGRSLVHFDLTNGPSNGIYLAAITGEHSTNVQNYGVFFDNAVKTPSYLTVDSCRFPNGIAMISAGASVVCDDFHLRALSNGGVGGGIVISGVLQNSTIQEYANNVTIGTSTNNVLSVSTPNLTVTTRSGDSWMGSNTHTWTPNLAAVTTAGPGSTSNNRAHYHGQQVTVEAIFSGYTTFSIAAGGAITGLPRAIQVGFGIAEVYDLTNHALIGMGHISGTSFIMPTTVAGANQVGIRATYFVS